MTFGTIAFKSFRTNFQRYLAYFLCSSFAIAVFFLYINMLLNPDFAEAGKSVEASLRVTATGVAIFAVVFVSYAHNAFVRARSREFGLYLSLGMTHKDIHRLVTLENCGVAALSLSFGLVAGSVFARLFHLAVVSILGLQQIGFRLIAASYLWAIGLFSLIFCFVVLSSIWLISRLEIIELSKSSRASDRQAGKGYLVLAIGGLVLVVGAFLLLHLYGQGAVSLDEERVVLLSLACCLSGLYLIISQLGTLLLKGSRALRTFYYRRIISINQLEHRFSQHKRVLFAIALLSAIAVYYIGSVWTSYSLTLETATQNYPFHLGYVETPYVDSPAGVIKVEIDDEIVAEILRTGETKLTEHLKLDFAAVGSSLNGPRAMITLVPLDQYQIVAGSADAIAPGEAIMVLADERPASLDGQIGDIISLVGQQRMEFIPGRGLFPAPPTRKDVSVKAIVHHNVVNRGSRQGYLLVVHPDDFALFAANNPQRGTFHLLSFADWRKTPGIAARLAAVFADLNPYISDVYGEVSDVPIESVGKVQVYGHITERFPYYEQLKQENSFHLFIMGFVGLLFFFSAGSVLYLKLFSELDSSRRMFQSLFRIGLQRREMARIISHELRLLFFIPLLLGSLLGLGYITAIGIAMSQLNDYLRYSLPVVGVYFVLQCLFYLLTRQRYVQEIARV